MINKPTKETLELYDRLNKKFNLGIDRVMDVIENKLPNRDWRIGVFPFHLVFSSRINLIDYGFNSYDICKKLRSLGLVDSIKPEGFGPYYMKINNSKFKEVEELK